MQTAFALVACAILALLAIFQVALALGAPFGRLAWGGGNVVLPVPLRAASAFSVVVYAFCAAIVLDRAGLWDVFAGDRVSGVGTWVLAAYFSVGVVMNALSRSVPERAVMTPVAGVLAISCLVLALG